MVEMIVRDRHRNVLVDQGEIRDQDREYFGGLFNAIVQKEMYVKLIGFLGGRGVNGIMYQGGGESSMQESSEGVKE